MARFWVSCESFADGWAAGTSCDAGPRTGTSDFSPEVNSGREFTLGFGVTDFYDGLLGVDGFPVGRILSLRSCANEAAVCRCCASTLCTRSYG